VERAHGGGTKDTAGMEGPKGTFVGGGRKGLKRLLRESEGNRRIVQVKGRELGNLEAGEKKERLRERERMED
jgi:hypothetical protein